MIVCCDYLLCPGYAVDTMVLQSTERDRRILSLQLLLQHLRILFIRSPRRDVIAANAISIPDRRQWKDIVVVASDIRIATERTSTKP